MTCGSKKENKRGTGGGRKEKEHGKGKGIYFPFAKTLQLFEILSCVKLFTLELSGKYNCNCIIGIHHTQWLRKSLYFLERIISANRVFKIIQKNILKAMAWLLMNIDKSTI